MKANEHGSIAPAKRSVEGSEPEFSRCRGLLKVIAERVLSGDDDVEEAMRRSYRAAASRRSTFRSDGEFRRWLARTVLNEALMILHEKESAAEGSSELVFWQVC